MSSKSDVIIDANFISGLIDVLDTELSDKQKEKVYYSLIYYLDDCGVDDITEFQGIDPFFDNAIDKFIENYESKSKDDFDNEDYDE